MDVFVRESLEKDSLDEAVQFSSKINAPTVIRKLLELCKSILENYKFQFHLWSPKGPRSKIKAIGGKEWEVRLLCSLA